MPRTVRVAYPVDEVVLDLDEHLLRLEVQFQRVEDVVGTPDLITESCPP
jgi:hypothetical protein